MLNLFEKILDLIFPPACGICGKEINTYLCKKCEDKINKITCVGKDNYENKYFSSHMYLFKYEGIIRSKIISYKFDDNPYLYKTFCEIFVKNKKVCGFLQNYDIIIPVPISKKRKLERGYNQTELILKFIEKELKKLKEKSKRDLKINKQMQKRYLNIQLNTESLIKIKNTKPQSKSNLKERINNVKGVYKLINEDKIKGKRIVIFDDIYTTGSTINECINCIKNIIINNSSGKEKIEIGTIEIGVLIIAKDYMEVI